MSEQLETVETDQPEAIWLEEESIRVRAYEISQSEDPGSPEENWGRAEAELREAANPGRSGSTRKSSGKAGNPGARKRSAAS